LQKPTVRNLKIYAHGYIFCTNGPLITTFLLNSLEHYLLYLVKFIYPRYSCNATYIMAVLSETDTVKEELLLTKRDDIVTLWDTSRPKNLLLLISCVIHNGDKESVLNTLVLLGNIVRIF